MNSAEDIQEEMYEEQQKSYRSMTDSSIETVFIKMETEVKIIRLTNGFTKLIIQWIVKHNEKNPMDYVFGSRPPKK